MNGRMNRGRPKDSRSGFTLVEFLLAMGLSAVILSSVYSMLYAASRNWKNMKQRTQLYQSGRAMLESLENDLENAVPLSLVPFSGDPAALNFAAVLTLPAATGEEGIPDRKALGRVSYSWDERSGILQRNWEALLPEAVSFSQKGRQAFSAQVGDFSITYAYQDALRSPTSWEPSWSHGGGLPEGVKVRLVLTPPGGGQAVTLEKTVRILHGRMGRSVS